MAATEEDLSDLRGQMAEMAGRLMCRLRRAALTVREYEVVSLRYVACMNFRDIETELGMSDATVFFHHRNALKKILEPTIEFK